MVDSPDKQAAIRFHHENAGLFDARYHDFEADPYTSTFTYGRRKVDAIIDAELKDLPVGSTLLDVGCGTGFDLKRFTSRGFRVTGIEPAEAMRRMAQANNPTASIIPGDIERLPLPDATFDVVLCIEVVRYLHSPRLALRELARVTKPGGVTIVTAAPLLSLNAYALVHTFTSRIHVPGFAKVRQSFTTAARAAADARAAGFATVTLTLVEVPLLPAVS
jgi:ubiquinone/menaquinone biosynthesis C-methylase UbiE